MRGTGRSRPKGSLHGQDLPVLRGGLHVEEACDRASDEGKVR